MVQNGDEGIRTHDPLLARQVLSQLSYTPKVFFLKPYIQKPYQLVSWQWLKSPVYLYKEVINKLNRQPLILPYRYQ